MAKPMKYKFRCAKCGKEYPANSEGWISPKSKKIYCKECLEKSDKPNTDSVKAYPIKTNTSIVPGTTSKPGTTLPWPKALDKEQIDRMLESARSKAQEITGEESHPFAVAIFKAQLLAAEQSFSLALSQKVAQEQSSMQENKLRMIKQVKGE